MSAQGDHIASNFTWSTLEYFAPSVKVFLLLLLQSYIYFCKKAPLLMFDGVLNALLAYYII